MTRYYISLLLVGMTLWTSCSKSDDPAAPDYLGNYRLVSAVTQQPLATDGTLTFSDTELIDNIDCTVPRLVIRAAQNGNQESFTVDLPNFRQELDGEFPAAEIKCQVNTFTGTVFYGQQNFGENPPPPTVLLNFGADASLLQIRTELGENTISWESSGFFYLMQSGVLTQAVVNIRYTFERMTE